MAYSKDKPILVAGAGIGGLAVAAGLTQRGYDVVVLERSPEANYLQGTGLTIWTNGVQAIRRLGLMDAMERAGSPLKRTLVHDASTGDVLVDTPVTAYQTRFGAPSIGLRRSHLVQILYEACKSAQVTFNVRAQGYVVGDDGVTLQLESGKEIKGSILIGADGIRSAIRSQMLRDGQPSYLGHTVWRGIAPVTTAFLPQTVAMYWGPRGVRGGAYPVDTENACWFVGVNAEPGGKDEADKKKGVLLRRIAKFKGALTSLVEATPDDKILRTDVFHRPNLVPWGSGPVTLIGDAAHAMPTVMGQGACQTLEDAVVLAECLQKADHLTEGLREYERRRIERVRWVREQVYKIGKYQEWESPVSIWLRNTMTRIMPPEMTRKTWDGLMEFPG